MVTSLAVLSGVVSGVLLGSVTGVLALGEGEVLPVPLPPPAQPASRETESARERVSARVFFSFISS